MRIDPRKSYADISSYFELCILTIKQVFNEAKIKKFLFTALKEYSNCELAKNHLRN